MSKKTIPTNDKTRKPTPKKGFSLDDYKKKVGSEDVPDKELRWLKCSPALQKATGMMGFPIGYVSLARGHSNVGKSTAVCEAIVSAQKENVLPIIIDTENNLGTERLKNMGFDWDGEYILIDNEYLLTEFGKKQDPKRNEAAIEDLAECIKFFILEQESGNLPRDLLFAIDSIGTLDCIKTINAQEKNTSDNNMWNAGAYEKSFKYLLNNTIPNSRKISKPYTNTLVAVQKIWIDNMGNGVVKHKGGETFYLGCRLGFHFGGIVSHSTKNVTATSKGRDVAYGTDTRVEVFKNQIDGPLGGISLKGNIMSMPHGFIFKEDLDTYKKDNIQYFRNLLDDETLNAEDISHKFTEKKNDEVDNGDDLIEKIEPNSDFDKK